MRCRPSQVRDRSRRQEVVDCRCAQPKRSMLTPHWSGVAASLGPEGSFDVHTGSIDGSVDVISVVVVAWEQDPYGFAPTSSKLASQVRESSSLRHLRLNYPIVFG